MQKKLPLFVSVILAAASLLGRDWKTTFPEDFAALYPRDTHVHVYLQDSALTNLLARFHLRQLDILLIDIRDPFFKNREPQYTDALNLARADRPHVGLCTTFSPYDFEQTDFARKAMDQLNRDFAEGAVAVKIYKTIGMQIKTRSGKYLMADDPVFDPIYDDIAKHNRTVVAHLAEPTSCWQPPNPASPDYSYYNEHPDEYAYKHPEWPSKQTILQARDHMLQKHPALKVVGAHLGSMEVDVDDMAKRFDRYPNFAVDTAARVEYLTLQPRAKVRDFLLRYQDRVLYATDFNLLPGQNSKDAVAGLAATYRRDWTYFATTNTVKFGSRDVPGLGLPAPVLRKLYHENAARWIPGLVGSGAKQ